MYKQVLEFHRVFGHPVGERPQLLSYERLQMRRDWQDDERLEFDGAIRVLDIVGAADAIADEIYFLIGMAVEMGLPMGKIFKAVHAANMRKVWRTGDHFPNCPINTQGNGQCTCGLLRYNDVGRVLKPAHWVGPEDDIMKILEGSHG